MGDGNAWMVPLSTRPSMRGARRVLSYPSRPSIPTESGVVAVCLMPLPDDCVSWNFGRCHACLYESDGNPVHIELPYDMVSIDEMRREVEDRIHKQVRSWGIPDPGNRLWMPSYTVIVVYNLRSGRWWPVRVPGSVEESPLYWYRNQIPVAEEINHEFCEPSRIPSYDCGGVGSFDTAGIW